MKTAEEIAIKHGLYHSSTGKADDKAVQAMQEYAAQLTPKWTPVSEVTPPFNTLVLLRGVIDWRSKESVTYFADEVQNDCETLEYGRYGYYLKNNSDYLLVPAPNPEEVCSEYITHWMPLPQLPKDD